MKANIIRWVLIVSALLTIKCTVDDDGITSPIIDINKYIILKSLTADQNQLFTDNYTTTIKAYVVNPQDNPEPGIIVDFTATFGTITARDTTDSTGIAEAIFTSGINVGIAKVTARAGTKEDSLFLNIIVPASSLTLSVNEDSTKILADGESQVRMKVTAIDDYSNPQSGLKVYFLTDYGQIEESGYTDENGECNATLVSLSDSNDVVATIYASLQPIDITRTITSTPRFIRYDHSRIPHIINNKSQGKGSSEPFIEQEFDATLNKQQTKSAITATNWADSLQITFKGITIEALRGRSELLANGEDLTDIYVTISESESGNPVTYHIFNVSTTKGTILGNKITNDLGRATVQLRSGTKSGVAEVNVSIGTVFDKTEFNFISTGPTGIKLTATDQYILADGESSTQVIATVSNALDGPVEGVEVEFNTTHGNSEVQSNISDVNGRVTAIITSDANSTDIFSDINARIVNYSDLMDSIRIVFKGVSLTVWSDDDYLVADGINNTAINASIRQTSTNSPVSNRTVYFISNLGAISSPVVTDGNGIAQATLTTGLFSGKASITAIFGNSIQDTTEVTFLNSGAHSIALTYDKTSIIADGEDYIILSTTVLDTLGNPVVGTPVFYTSELGSFFPSTVSTNSYGIAEVQLIGPASTLDSKTKAYVNISNNQLVHNQIYDFIGKQSFSEDPGQGLPSITNDVNRSSDLIDSVEVDFRGIYIESFPHDTIIVGNGINSTTIEAQIRESTTFITIQNKPVYFTTNNGSIIGEAFTNALGIAKSTLTSSRKAGTANVFIRFGSSLYDTVSVEYLISEPSTISLGTNSTSIIANGENTSELTAIIHDVLV